MSSALTVEVREGIARVVLDLPGEPVNKITRGLRDELQALLDRVSSDSGIRAAVLISGKPENFIAGADIDEFTRLPSRDAAYQLVRTGQALINRLEAAGKPIVAAINGSCVGGGLEAALACTYRVATDHPKTVLGLPEVQLGIIPGAGGCQRLPRAIGIRAALDIILAGKTVPASRAYRMGMVHELVHPAILEQVATDAAQRLASGWRPPRRKTDVATLLLERNPLGRALVFRMARKAVRKKTRGHYPAPPAALHAVEHGVRHGLEAGLDMEAALFAELAVSEVSRELVNIFFATTALKKDSGVDLDVKPVRVKRLAVAGAGFMGAGIGATAVAQAGVDVRFRDKDLPSVGKGLAAARKIIREREKRRRISRYESRRLLAFLSGGTDWAGFGSADLVIEAVFEDLDVKHQVFRELEHHTSDDCILASNTSTIPIGRIADAVTCPERVLGMHFFSPVERMPLLEVIVAEQTAPWAVATAVDFGRRMGKTVVVVQDHPGFWVNRILAPYMNEAGHLLAEGVQMDVIDRTMRDFGFPVGPVTLLDEVGLDVAVKAAKVMHEAFGDRLRPAPGVAALVADGRMGRKNGRGLYSYRKGKKSGVDKTAYAVIGAGTPRTLPSVEIEQRLVYAMLNEAARALDEGVVRSPRDGDIAAIFGIGFPPFRGGPLRTLDRIGAAEAVRMLEELSRRHGDRFAPAAVLVRHAESSGRFYPPA